MDDIESFNRDNQRNYFKSIIKSLLLIILGIIIGAGIVSIFWFLSSRHGEGISQETQAGIVKDFKKDLEKSFSTVFGKNSVIDVYIMEKREDTIGISTTVNLFGEQFKEIFGIKPEGLYPGEIRGLVIIAQAEYIKKEGKWALKEDPKVYQGTELSLLQETLSTSRNKARDFAIKGELSGMRVAAELWFIDHEDSYNGFCKGLNAQESMAFIADNEKIALCDDTVTTWAAFAPLYDTTAQCFCVDSRGTAKALNTSCTKTAVTVCP